MIKAEDASSLSAHLQRCTYATPDTFQSDHQGLDNSIPSESEISLQQQAQYWALHCNKVYWVTEKGLEGSSFLYALELSAFQTHNSRGRSSKNIYFTADGEILDGCMIMLCVALDFMARRIPISWAAQKRNMTGLSVNHENDNRPEPSAITD